MRGRPVVTIHEATYRLHPELLPRRGRLSVPRLYLGLYGWSGRHAAAVIASSHAAKEDIVRGYRVPPERIHVCPLAPGDAFREVTWPEAYARVEELLRPILEADGADAVATYVGNPVAQSLASLYLRGYHKALGTRHLYTVGTVDQHPKSVANALLYGTQFSMAVPDLDRTSFLLVLGTNPAVSQGSLVSAPDIRRRLRGGSAGPPRPPGDPAGSG